MAVKDCSPDASTPEAPEKTEVPPEVIRITHHDFSCVPSHLRTRVGGELAIRTLRQGKEVDFVVELVKRAPGRSWFRSAS